jgi:hypothetical protein
MLCDLFLEMPYTISKKDISMRVMLLTQNRTVQEMIGLAIREIEGVDLIVYESIQNVRGGRYDMMIVDDAFGELKKALPLAKHLAIPIKTLLSNDPSPRKDGFDHRIKKPFVPDEIRLFIQERKSDLLAHPPPQRAQKRAAPTKQTVTTPQTPPKASPQSSKTAARVLDPNEIDTIKRLLEEEGLHVVGETTQKDTTNQSRMRSKRPDGDALVHALSSMKPKALRQLLKGATVHIQITFPENP